MITTEPRWGTVAEGVAEFGCGESTLRRWIDEGRVRSERVGPRRIRVDLNSLTEPTQPGLPSAAQLTAALAAIDPTDLAELARIAGKLLPAVGDSAMTFAHVWSAVGGVARVHAKAADIV